MRVSPRRLLTLLLTLCMTVIVYLNVLSFVEPWQQRAVSLYADLRQHGEGDDGLMYPGKFVVRGGEVLSVNSERYHELVRQQKAELENAGHHQTSAIRTVRLHAGLDTTRILLDAKDPGHRNKWSSKLQQQQLANTDLTFREIRSPRRRERGRTRSVWPDPQRRDDDRILDQLLYVPESVQRRRAATAAPHTPTNTSSSGGPEPLVTLKTILMWSGLGDLKAGRSRFIEDRCEVDTCYVTENAAMADRAHLVVFNFDPVYYTWTRPPHQLWMLWMLESPLHTATLRDLKDQVNWTATYRADSTLVTPYEKFVPYKDVSLPVAPQRNYAASKTKKVAWFVSNCGARNRRLEYAEELGNHIQVDVYGGCGPFKCSRLDQDACLDILRRDYKFYLAFENSNCDYYVTEKFFWNGLKAEVVPIVMGARRADYLNAAPPFSYIHVEDFSSPRELAAYLHKVDQNETLYNAYFRWKTVGEFINTKFWCRLCSLLHDDSMPTHHYTNIERWWRPNGTCTLDRWDNPVDHITDWKKYVYSNL